MKRIILMRHANAVELNLTSDFNLQLSNMGKIQAEAAGNFLADFAIDKVLVSPAKRTTQTLDIILQCADIHDIEPVRALYDSSSNRIIEIISTQDDAVHTLMILGHNPTIYQLALELSQNNTKEYERILVTTISTAQVVVIEFVDLLNWNNIQLKLGQGKIVNIFNPNLDE